MRVLASLMIFALLAVACDGGDGESTPTGITIPRVLTAQTFVAFDPAQGQHPEGLIADGDGLLVGFAALGRVVRIDSAGQMTPAFELDPPFPPFNGSLSGILLGLSRGPDGATYAAVAALEPSVTSGIYRAPPGADRATLFASDPSLRFPNSLAWDDKGYLYVTDSLHGTLFRVSLTGKTEAWVQHALLSGKLESCPGNAGFFGTGANGVAFVDGELRVANTHDAKIITVPIEADGSAGTPTLFAGPDCDHLAGADGIVAMGDGSLLVTAQNAHQVVWVSPDGQTLRTLIAGDPLDQPANLIRTGEAEVMLVNVAFFSAPEAARPGVVRLTLGPSSEVLAQQRASSEETSGSRDLSSVGRAQRSEDRR